MGLGVARALCDIPAGRRAPEHRGGEPFPGPGRGARARGGAGRPSCGPARLEGVHAELADADVVLSAVAAESHVLTRGTLLRASPAPCWSSTWAFRAMSIRPSGTLPSVTLLDMDTLSVSVSRALGDRAGGVRGRPGDRRRRGGAIPHRQPPAGRGAGHRRTAGPARVVARERARAPSGPAGRPERGRVGAGGRRHPWPPWPRCCTSPPCS